MSLLPVLKTSSIQVEGNRAEWFGPRTVTDPTQKQRGHLPRTHDPVIETQPQEQCLVDFGFYICFVFIFLMFLCQALYSEMRAGAGESYR